MQPTLNSSQIKSYLNVKSLRLAISGATYPGVPHFGNGYSSMSNAAANPKSTIFSVSN